jgi:hypothetical protein
MDIPVAVPVGSCHGAKIEPYASSELYVLEQHQEALRVAEKGLEQTLAAAEDFFSSPQERDSTYTEIQERPDDVYDKPFKRKIAQAVLEVRRCRSAVEWASESVVDTSLTPAQVKAQVKQMLEAQRIYMERKISEERSILETEMRKLREELEEERQHRLAFQAKVKDFSEDVYMTIWLRTRQGNHIVPMQSNWKPHEKIYHSFCNQKYVNNSIFTTGYHGVVMNPDGSTLWYHDLMYKKYGLDQYTPQTIPPELCKLTSFDGTDS